MNRKEIHIELFSSGYCTASSRYIYPDANIRVVQCHAIWALIHHPSLGKILFDTGYSSRFFTATHSFPNRIYRWITPVFHKPEDSCISQLARINIDPAKIDSIVISHFHADHIGGLADFPGCEIWCSEEGLSYAVGKHRLTSVFKGVLKKLIPSDIMGRACFIDKRLPEYEMSGLKLWRWAEDISFVDLPGHARGQVGLFITNTNYGDVMLCADAAWSAESVRKRFYPPGIASLIGDDYRDLVKTIDRLHELAVSNPGLLILPSHCQSTYSLTMK